MMRERETPFDVTGEPCFTAAPGTHRRRTGTREVGGGTPTVRIAPGPTGNQKETRQLVEASCERPAAQEHPGRAQTCIKGVPWPNTRPGGKAGCVETSGRSLTLSRRSR